MLSVAAVILQEQSWLVVTQTVDHPCPIWKWGTEFSQERKSFWDKKDSNMKDLPTELEYTESLNNRDIYIKNE